ncbi:MAG: dockerin type I repeat-containing protein [Acidobacteria bacterium]|nr:dockerin type I repeat-containing protein [Acidobacteriota bacterium]
MNFGTAKIRQGRRSGGLLLGIAFLILATAGDAAQGPDELPPLTSEASQGGDLGVPIPLFPPDNWWNLDISAAPVDPDSAQYISFINNGGNRRMHPDFGGEVSPGSDEVYGMPYIVVDGDQPKVPVEFLYWDESDGVDHPDNTSLPFYPIPIESQIEAHWIECGPPGNVDLRSSCDRHMLIVDRDNRHLYELWNVYFDGAQWHAGSGAFFDLDTNDRRPDGWTSADAAGLAILPGLVRYDEVYGTGPIEHAFRVTVRATNGHVWPASHTAGSTTGALPMGARLRLKPDVDISGYDPAVQRIFQAMKTYGLIVADNGSDLYVQGTFDTRWDNDVLNPAFHSLHASDFEVIELGWQPASTASSGDANSDGSVTVADIFYVINHLFAGGPLPAAAFDPNGDASVTVADIFYLINYLFAGGPAPL